MYRGRVEPGNGIQDLGLVGNLRQDSRRGVNVLSLLLGVLATS